MQTSKKKIADFEAKRVQLDALRNSKLNKKIVWYVKKLRKKKMGSKGKEKRKISKVMNEFAEGKLHSGSKSRPVVKSRPQAVAIALSESKKVKK